MIHACQCSSRSGVRARNLGSRSRTIPRWMALPKQPFVAKMNAYITGLSLATIRAERMGWKSQGQQAMRAASAAVERAWQHVICWLLNTRRRLLRGRWADYAVIALDHDIAERAADVPWWYAYIPGLRLPLSLDYLHDALRRMADDPDLKGVVLLMKGAGLSLSQAQSLASLLARFRRWDDQRRPAGAAAKQIV